MKLKNVNFGSASIQQR